MWRFLERLWKSLPPKGELELLSPEDYASEHLSPTPPLIVYLPPGYSRSQRRYPVLYALDGQNLFDPKTSFAGEWKLDKNIEALVQAKLLEGIIVVGIYNNGVLRVDEYTPTRIPSRWEEGKHEGGRLGAFSRFLCESLKPYIDSRFRTLPDRRNTGVMGSSLGGLAAFYLLGRHPRIFSKAGVISPSFWWDDARTARDIEGMEFPQDVRIYMDGGWQEREDESYMVLNMRAVYRKLREIGLRDFANLFYHEDPQGIHNEADWARRGKMPILYLYGDFSAKIQKLDVSVDRGPRADGSLYVIPQIHMPHGMLFTALSGTFGISPREAASIDEEGRVTLLRESKPLVSFQYGSHRAVRRI